MLVAFVLYFKKCFLRANMLQGVSSLTLACSCSVRNSRTTSFTTLLTVRKMSKEKRVFADPCEGGPGSKELSRAPNITSGSKIRIPVFRRPKAILLVLKALK